MQNVLPQKVIFLACWHPQCCGVVAEAVAVIMNSSLMADISKHLSQFTISDRQKLAFLHHHIWTTAFWINFDSKVHHPVAPAQIADDDRITKRRVNRSHTALRVLCPNEFAKHTLNISDSPVRPIPNNARALGLPWHVHAPYSTQNNTVGVLGAKSLPAGLRKHSPPIPKKEYQRTKTEQVEPIPSLINQT
jgi:hypothetical protein